jgi:hypothetical protein
MVGIMRGPARPRRAAWIRSVPLADVEESYAVAIAESSAYARSYTDVQLAPAGKTGKETMKKTRAGPRPNSANASHLAPVLLGIPKVRARSRVAPSRAICPTAACAG